MVFPKDAGILLLPALLNLIGRCYPLIYGIVLFTLVLRKMVKGHFKNNLVKKGTDIKLS